MSIPVELRGLAEVLARYRFAYLLTSRAGSAPHVAAVVPILEAGELLVEGIGRRTRENLLAHPLVSLVWPPGTESEHSLIVDGEGVSDGSSLRVRPSRAVLHRPAPRLDPVAPDACASDCVELEVPIPPR